MFASALSKWVLFLELSFSSPLIRSLALDPKAQPTLLDDVSLSAFKSIVADFRAAWDVGDLPDFPKVVDEETGRFELSWKLSPQCTLITSIVTDESRQPEAWKFAHRIKLERLLYEGQEVT